MTGLLTFDGVAAGYQGGVAALHDITLSVPAGSFTALLGANGAGKSTTLKAASNLLVAERGRVTAGHILFDGLDVTRTTSGTLLRAGLVPVLEGRRCFRNLTVAENLSTGAIGAGITRSVARQRADFVYDLFPRLTRLRHAKAGLISGGEQQMVAIGRGLMAGPRLFVLDEPSMGLAPLLVDEIFHTLTRLNREQGLTILMAEQNSTAALRHAGHAVLIETGRSVLAGPAAGLQDDDRIGDAYLGGVATI